MKILIVTDAWTPQINGVVRTLQATGRELRAMGHDVTMITPEGHRTVACPSYPEIRLTRAAGGVAQRTIEACAPDAIHIATEGPLGLATRRYCLRNGLAFTTSFHTRFAEYVHVRWRVPLAVSYAWLRWFHAPATAVMVATPSMRAELIARGFERTVLWTRGVDLQTFSPGPGIPLYSPGPVLMAVGRVAIEKNLRAFLDLDLDAVCRAAGAGSKWVVGDGPQLEALRTAYPQVRYVGAQTTLLADYYRAADVVVFPSRTDTFGLVLLEAMACGTPVAAYPVPGPLDVVADSPGGALDPDLGKAVRRALGLRREDARARALTFSWARATTQFTQNLVRVGAARLATRTDRVRVSG